MLLAELEVRHSRAVAPTRRVALGLHWVRTDPPPGFGGVLLGGIVAAHLDAIDDDMLVALLRLIDDLEASRRIAQPRLRHRFQTDVVGLDRSRHKLVGRGEQVTFEIDDHGAPVPPRPRCRDRRRGPARRRAHAGPSHPADMTARSEHALLITPGAGHDRDQSSLVAIEAALVVHGYAVERMDFPYRRAGRKAPDRAPVLIAAVRHGAAELAARTGLPAGRIALGGRSRGRRLCSMAVGEGLPARAAVPIALP